MSSREFAISVRNLTKTYRMFGHPGDRIKQAMTFGLRRYHREFTALNDVSFDMKKGETIGIVGHNGSGKSTLLQLLCGILKPTAGQLIVNGRLSALLELGAGFNPEFTGRENVYFQGTLLGLTPSEIDEKFDELNAFADIGDFINQPVRTYSTGMFVRLAFSVAVHVAPEVLIVDEALAVGDLTFQTRALDRMRQLIRTGTSVLVVSHDMPALKTLCDRVIQLDHGNLVRFGPSGEVCDAYVADQIVTNPPARSTSPRGCSNNLSEVIISNAELVDDYHTPTTRLRFGDFITLRVTLLVQRDVLAATIAFYIRDRHRVEVLGTNNVYEGTALTDLRAGSTLRVSYRFRNCLRGGQYTITLLAAQSDALTAHYFDWREDVLSFESEDLLGQPRWAIAAPFAEVTVQYAPFS